MGLAAPRFCFAAIMACTMGLKAEIDDVNLSLSASENPTQVKQNVVFTWTVMMTEGMKPFQVECKFPKGVSVTCIETMCDELINNDTHSGTFSITDITRNHNGQYLCTLYTSLNSNCEVFNKESYIRTEFNLTVIDMRPTTLIPMDDLPAIRNTPRVDNRAVWMNVSEIDASTPQAANSSRSPSWVSWFKNHWVYLAAGGGGFPFLLLMVIMIVVTVVKRRKRGANVKVNHQIMQQRVGPVIYADVRIVKPRTPNVIHGSEDHVDYAEIRFDR